MPSNDLESYCVEFSNVGIQLGEQWILRDVDLAIPASPERRYRRRERKWGKHNNVAAGPRYT